MTVEQRIRNFDTANEPLYIVAHDDGAFSLCLPLTAEYKDFCQGAFNRYAEQIGDPIIEEGLYTHGNGYEWELVFRKAFEKEPRIGEIEFDCEAGAFFCMSKDLSLLEEFGGRFRKLCQDTEGFARLVCTALTEARQQREYDEKNGTVRWYIDGAVKAAMDIITPDHHLRIQSGQGEDLWKGKNIRAVDVRTGELVEVKAEELLRYQVTAFEDDIKNDHLYITAEAAPEEEQDITLSP